MFKYFLLTPLFLLIQFLNFYFKIQFSFIEIFIFFKIIISLLKSIDTVSVLYFFPFTRSSLSFHQFYLYLCNIHQFIFRVPFCISRSVSINRQNPNQSIKLLNQFSAKFLLLALWASLFSPSISFMLKPCTPYWCT